MEEIIDCHAHLVGENTNAAKTIENMKKDGLAAVIAIGTSPDDIKKVLSIAKENKNIFAALAYHPEYADEISEEELELLRQLAKEKEVVAIGECGLDYHFRQDNKEKQKQLFIWHIKLAKALQKPLMIHLRDAEDDAIAILKEHGLGLKNVIIHCYSSVSERITDEFVKMGCYISFAGNFTFKKYRQEDIKRIPQDHILCETDSPYLAPVPLRGTVNEPKNVHHVAQAMADVLQINADKLKQILVQNARRVFEI